MAHVDEVQELESEIAERQQRLDDLRTSPMTPEEASQLAKSDPISFNERFDACRRAGRNPIKKGEPA